MLLALTNTASPATDLGFLLHKHPDRAQRYPLSFGTAHVFYPETGEARCTACLLVEVDPIDLVRGKAKTGGLQTSTSTIDPMPRLPSSRSPSARYSRRRWPAVAPPDLTGKALSS